MQRLMATAELAGQAQHRNGPASVPVARMWFTVLGPVRAWNADREIDLGPRQQRALLALLLARASQPVTLSEIVDVLWGQSPPDSAVNTVHRCVGTLRRALQPELSIREAGRWLARSGGGYRLVVDSDTVDLLLFRQLIAQASAETATAAVTLYIQALKLWQGLPACGIGAEVRGHPTFAALEREYLAVARQAADAALGTGQAHLLLPLIGRAADQEALDEPLQARLMLLLAAAGHQAAALELFEKVSGRLAEELGIDPGPELAQARDRILREPHTLATPDNPVAARPAARRSNAVHRPLRRTRRRACPS